jgi:hypothetical protein
LVRGGATLLSGNFQISWSVFFDFLTKDRKNQMLNKNPLSSYVLLWGYTVLVCRALQSQSCYRSERTAESGTFTQSGGRSITCEVCGGKSLNAKPERGRFANKAHGLAVPILTEALANLK